MKYIYWLIIVLIMLKHLHPYLLRTTWENCFPFYVSNCLILFCQVTPSWLFNLFIFQEKFILQENNFLYLYLNLLLCFILEYNFIRNDEPFFEFPGLLFLVSKGIRCYQLITHWIVLNTTLHTFDIYNNNQATCST